MLETSLFQGELVRLTTVRPEVDAPVEARWMHDPDYHLIARRGQPFNLLTADELKKAYAEEEKSTGRKASRFRFAIRRREDDELVGFLLLRASSWSNRVGALEYSFAGPAEEARYGADTLSLAIRYAFDELNLHRLATYVPEHLTERAAQLTTAGFQCEVRRRKVVYRAGQYLDELVFGMLETEWRDGGAHGGEQ